MVDITVTDDPDAGRFEARADGVLAGYTAYEVRDGAVVFTHTEVEDAFEGQGVGSTLVKAALDNVREFGGRGVRPLCPFVRSWIDRHPDYADLVVPGNAGS